MDGSSASLRMFGLQSLDPQIGEAALVAAQSVLSRADVTASEAIRAYQADLMLAEGLAEDERTDEHYREHGASLKACEAYYGARDAAESVIAKNDPSRAAFKVLFTLAE